MAGRSGFSLSETSDSNSEDEYVSEEEEMERSEDSSSLESSGLERDLCFSGEKRGGLKRFLGLLALERWTRRLAIDRVFSSSEMSLAPLSAEFSPDE